ncbi:MAG: hypothetical protein MK169_05280 [Candidatus Thalassarchaeum sp.]|nr:hypothetical protein [Candidatus Thalassarchaeum sp.]
MRVHQPTFPRLVVLGCFALLLAGSTQGYSTGIGGDENGDGDVALAGCTCHNELPDNSVTVILDDLPYHYSAGVSYTLTIQLIGGPDIDSSSNTGGFSMRVTSGTLMGAEGYENLVQNWEEDVKTLSHAGSGVETPDRAWMIVWTAPESGTGPVTFWLAGNSVDGDGLPSELDRWNRLSVSVEEGEDSGDTRTVFSGNGEIEPPAPVETHVDLHHMGAKLRAHWLGVLGFTAVILVILFCGFFLRYGFSRHYVGRSNLLKLRIKHLRRGDQL